MSKPGEHKSHGKIKKAYDNWISAVAHAFMHSKDQKTIVSIYNCPTCGKYHIGKQRTSCI